MGTIENPSKVVAQIAFAFPTSLYFRSSQRAEGFAERKPDDRERGGAAWRADVMRREGAPLRLDDEVLTVDQRAVEIEKEDRLDAHGLVLAYFGASAT